MLPKINRIKKKNDFEAIFKKGASFRNSILVLRVLKNNLNNKRFAFVTSLKVSKNAVVRNKIRRRMADIIRFDFEKLENGLDMVLVALPGIEKKDFQELKELLNNLFIKAKIIAEK